MPEIDLEQPVTYLGKDEKDFTGIVIDKDPKIFQEQVDSAPVLTFYKLISMMLLESVPLENADITKKLIKITDSLEKCWNDTKKWSPTEDDIGKVEELIQKIKDERFLTGKTKGFVYRVLENYRKELEK